LHATGFLYGLKSRCKIGMKKDTYEEPTVLYGPSLFLSFLADMYDQHFQLSWLIEFLKHASCANGHNLKTK
jgi:hypothetical protein